MSTRAQSGADSFLPLVEELVSSEIHISSGPDDVWIHVEPPGAVVPTEGWKLHVSAVPSSAEEVLRRTVPVVTAEGAAFKVAAGVGNLYELNQGLAGRSQVGKFVTVYPRDESQAVRLAESLDAATSGLRGPRVPSDNALSPSSLVHYRYGEFVMYGAPEDAVRTTSTPDHDPFAAAGIVTPSEQKLIAGRYLITSTFHRSVRGSVHLAVDVPHATTCILKRAWRDACAMPDGRDARDRLDEEADLLRSLAPDPHFPEVRDAVEHEHDRFLVMEYVRGTTWARWAHSETKPAADAIDAAMADLVGAVERIHALGYVHRDLSPANVILRDEGGVSLVDFELALRIGERTNSFGAGTPGYMSPNQMEGGPASVDDDRFALAALSYLAANGRDPDPVPDLEKT